jgi:amino acid transporter
VSKRPSSVQAEDDAVELSRFGYAQLLLREMGGFSSFALSFSVISILTGALTLYGHGLSFGGPRVMGLGWPLVALMTLAVAASLAELASAFPTAGALYHWSALLGGPGAGFATAWLNLVGQFAITAAIDYGLAQFLADFLGWTREDNARVLSLYAVLLLSHAVLNHVGVRVVAWFNTFSAWYHMAGVALIVGALAVFGLQRPPAFLLTAYTASPYPYTYGFLVGLLQAQWTFTGYDASAHVTEETRNPRRAAPWAMVLSVAVSGVAGYLLLYAITASIDDLANAARAPNPFLQVLSLRTPRPWARSLFGVAMGAMWFCGLASVTSNSRMLFAFARDGGLPFSSLLARVSPRFVSPHVAVWVSCAAAFLVALYSGAYNVMGALSTSALYASYGLPIGLGLWARRQGRWLKMGPWHLGAASSWVGGVALCWVGFVLVLFSLPPNLLSGVSLAGAAVALGVYWRLHAAHRFRGPPVAHLLDERHHNLFSRPK